MFLGVAQPNGQASSAAHNVKTPKQSNRKFKGVRQTRHTAPTEWLPGGSFHSQIRCPHPTTHAAE